MPVKNLPSNPNLNHLKSQAKDLLAARIARDRGVAQRIREFHPRFHGCSNSEIFEADFRLADAQLTTARECGFASWARLKRRVEKPVAADHLTLPHHERIEDADFRRAVALVDAGDSAGLAAWLREHPGLVYRRVLFEGGNYFRNPALLAFIAENPIRHGALPANIAEVAAVILASGANQDRMALNETLELVCSGCVPRQCGVQIPLIHLLCDSGADPAQAMAAALGHAEFEAVEALIQRGAPVNLPAATALGRREDAQRLLVGAGMDDRHRALALASQFGHMDIVRMLIDAGEDPSRYNPVGFHAHSTPLHQAALAGHYQTVCLLVERGARLDVKDTLWQGTPAEWAKHGGHHDIEQFLLAQKLLPRGPSGGILNA